MMSCCEIRSSLLGNSDRSNKLRLFYGSVAVNDCCSLDIMLPFATWTFYIMTWTVSIQCRWIITTGVKWSGRAVTVKYGFRSTKRTKNRYILSIFCCYLLGTCLWEFDTCQWYFLYSIRQFWYGLVLASDRRPWLTSKQVNNL